MSDVSVENILTTLDDLLTESLDRFVFPFSFQMQQLILDVVIFTHLAVFNSSQINCDPEIVTISENMYQFTFILGIVFSDDNKFWYYTRIVSFLSL